MVIIIGLLLLIDAVVHKGLVRVLLPKNFSLTHINISKPNNKITLISGGKFWAKAINTIPLMQQVDEHTGGIEMDVYFDTSINTFTVHHDVDKDLGITIDTLLKIYQLRKLTKSFWLDFKNLDSSNLKPSLLKLTQLKKDYQLNQKILVESSYPTLLTPFADSGFYTVYYTPMFNPYLANSQQIAEAQQVIETQLKLGKISAISGYYFQHPFLNQAFPNYPVLIWQVNDKWSLVNWVYNKKVQKDSSIFISLLP